MADTSSFSLYASAKLFGDECVDANTAFIQCKQRDRDPAACVETGEKVTACVLQTLRRLEEGCSKEFSAQKACLKTNNLGYEECRQGERTLKACWAHFKVQPASAAAPATNAEEHHA